MISENYKYCICKQFANEDGKWISDDKILSFTSYQTCLNIHVMHSLLSFEILNGRKRGISCDQYCVINIIEKFCEKWNKEFENYFIRIRNGKLTDGDQRIHFDSLNLGQMTALSYIINLCLTYE